MFSGVNAWRGASLTKPACGARSSNGSNSATQPSPRSIGRSRPPRPASSCDPSTHHFTPDAALGTLHPPRPDSRFALTVPPARMLRQREGPSVWSPRRVIRRPYNSSGSDESYPANCSGRRLRQLATDRYPAFRLLRYRCRLWLRLGCRFDRLTAKPDAFG